MFYLDGRGGAAAAAATRYVSSTPNEEENFGWWLSDQEIGISPRSYCGKDRQSSGSSASILSYIVSDDSGSCSFAQDVSRQEPESGICEKIELNSFIQDDLDIDLIERDAKEVGISPTTENDECSIREESESRAICYTPERLIRSQEYRIIIPSPRRFIFSQARFVSENKNREHKIHRCRKRLSCLIDPEQIGATQLKTLLNLPITDVRTHAVSSPIFQHERCTVNDFNAPIKSNDDSLADRNRYMRSTETIISSRSSYDKLNSTWDDCKSLAIHPSSLDDTSGIQSNDWSLETQSDIQNTPMCLCDELAIASKTRIASFSNDRGIVINEVTSILESLQSDPEKATVLLEEENRFYDDTSSHDQLTRLALAIETDVEVSSVVPDDPNNWIRHLRDKIKRLRLANKEIHRDICDLRTDFQCDEKKMMDLSNDTTQLLQDIHELRYLDDLLMLLKGELKRISRRNWPFILGHREPREELNLII